MNENYILQELADFCEQLEKEQEVNKQAAKAFFKKESRK